MAMDGKPYDDGLLQYLFCLCDDIYKLGLFGMVFFNSRAVVMVQSKFTHESICNALVNLNKFLTIVNISIMSIEGL